MFNLFQILKCHLNYLSSLPSQAEAPFVQIIPIFLSHFLVSTNMHIKIVLLFLHWNIVQNWQGFFMFCTLTQLQHLEQARVTGDTQ